MQNYLLNNKRALLVTGARQVGKTFTIRKVGKACFEHFVEVNFVERPEALKLFEEAEGTQDLLLRLSAFTNRKLVPGKTLIFFDEVQECKEMVTHTVKATTRTELQGLFAERLAQRSSGLFGRNGNVSA